MTDAQTTERLIKLGRDREAVAAAARDGRTDERGGSTMDGVEQLDHIIPALKALVRGIGPEELGLSTPCPNFTVAGVLEHMIGGASIFAPAFRGEAPEAAPGEASASGTVQDRWHHAVDDLLSAVHAPGAQERTIASPFGDVPGSMFARYVAFDGLVHGWDLSIATGQPYDPAGEVVAEVDAFARGLLQPEMRDGDSFAAETDAPADATPLERVVAFSGREVRRSVR